MINCVLNICVMPLEKGFIASYFILKHRVKELYMIIILYKNNVYVIL
jgi:hypothetical protein